MSILTLLSSSRDLNHSPFTPSFNPQSTREIFPSQRIRIPLPYFHISSFKLFISSFSLSVRLAIPSCIYSLLHTLPTVPFSCHFYCLLVPPLTPPSSIFSTPFHTLITPPPSIPFSTPFQSSFNPLSIPFSHPFNSLLVSPFSPPSIPFSLPFNPLLVPLQSLFHILSILF